MTSYKAYIKALFEIYIILYIVIFIWHKIDHDITINRTLQNTELLPGSLLHLTRSLLKSDISAGYRKQTLYHQGHCCQGNMHLLTLLFPKSKFKYKEKLNVKWIVSECFRKHCIMALVKDKFYHRLHLPSIVVVTSFRTHVWILF